MGVSAGTPRNAPADWAGAGYAVNRANAALRGKPRNLPRAGPSEKVHILTPAPLGAAAAPPAGTPILVGESHGI